MNLGRGFVVFPIEDGSLVNTNLLRNLTLE
jgi:hypothetical protein